jgi:hypothetical protein
MVMGTSQDAKIHLAVFIFGKTCKTPYIQKSYFVIAQKFAYFILPHILFCILFSITVFLSELCCSVLTKMPIFSTFIFFLSHTLSPILFSQADYYVLILARKKRLSFYRTFQRFVLFQHTSHQIIFYCQSPCNTCILFSVTVTCTRQILPPAATYPPPRLRPRCHRRNAAAATLPPPLHCRRHRAAAAAVLLQLHFPQQRCRCDTCHASAADNAALSPSCRRCRRRLQGCCCAAVLLLLLPPC